MSQPTVAILYGLAEGPALSKKLCHALKAAGFAITKNAEAADCIIAHSGGYFLLPDLQGKTILLVAPSCGHKGSLVGTQLRKLWRDAGLALQSRDFRAWLNLTSLHLIYFLFRPHSVVKMWRTARQPRGKILPTCASSRTGVMVCIDDPWSGLIGKEAVIRQPEYDFMSYQGGHDDLWLRPQAFVAILRYLHQTK